MTNEQMRQRIAELEEENRDMQSDLATVFTNLDWLREITGEDLESEDAQMVDAARARFKDRRAALSAMRPASEPDRSKTACNCKSYNRPDWGGSADQVIMRDLDGKEVCIDKCIAPLIKELWSSGIKTLSSCCGHGGQATAHVMLALSVDVPEAVEIVERTSTIPMHVSVWALPGTIRASEPDAGEVERIPLEPGNIASHAGKKAVLEMINFIPGFDAEQVAMEMARNIWKAMAQALNDSPTAAMRPAIDREKLREIRERAYWQPEGVTISTTDYAELLAMIGGEDE
ncbi:MAG: hypothetical protein CMF04_08915 [Hyphomonas sp.]|nr:hypothetical protein [Hyphomonas sp.]|tara:strand:+ start:3855 stop:4715 length:861 start_codon:yes stop_codon:yes gene_type:complete